MAKKIRLKLTIDHSPLLTVVAKAVLDTQFRQALIANPGNAIRNAGLELSPDELDTLSNLNPAEWGGLTLQALNARLAPIDDPSVTSCVAIA